MKNNLNDIWYIPRVAPKILLVHSRLISQKTSIFNILNLEEILYSFRHKNCKKLEQVKSMKPVESIVNYHFTYI